MPRLQLATLLALTLTSTLLAQTPTPEQWARVINLAGRQRMLTQKMSKEALFITANVAVEESQQSLGNTVKLFETTLRGLRDGNAEMGLPPTKDPEIVKQINKIGKMYGELRPIFSEVTSGGKLSPKQLTELAEKNVPVLVEMNKAVKMYEKAASGVLGGDKKAAVVINLAGKQRMLTQEATKELLLSLLDIEGAANRTNLGKTSALFGRTLKGLVEGDAELGLPGTKDAEILKQLSTVSGIWKSVQPSFDSVSGGGSITESELLALSKSNLVLLKEMNKAVQMYEKAAN